MVEASSGRCPRSRAADGLGSLGCQVARSNHHASRGGSRPDRVDHPADYWWYRARRASSRSPSATSSARPKRLLDVGSADGPSVGWMSGEHLRRTMDVDPRGLKPVRVCVPARRRCRSRTRLRRGRRVRRARALRAGGRGGDGAQTGAEARRQAADVRPGVPVGLDRPRRAGRPLPEVHEATSLAGGRSMVASWSNGRPTASARSSRSSSPTGLRDASAGVRRRRTSGFPRSHRRWTAC